MQIKLYIIFLLYFLLAVTAIYSQELSLKFNHISLEQELSSSEVNSIIQDSKGFMWFGTLYGLNRFDGYNMKVYRHNPENPKSISDNYIHTVFEDRNGTLWVGTDSGGLNKYDSGKEEFTRFVNNPLDSFSLSGNTVNCFFETEAGLLMIGTDNGLNIYHPAKNKGEKPQFEKILNMNINSILADENGNILLGTWQGLISFKLSDIKNKPLKTKLYLPDEENESSLISKFVIATYKDSNGIVWIGTTEGLCKMIVEDNSANSIKFKHYRHNEGDIYSLSHDFITSISEDHDGFIWIGTRGGGVNKFDKKSGKFISYKSDISFAGSIKNNSVQSLCIDKTGVLWLGTLGGGINNVDLRKKKFFHYKISLDEKTKVPGNFIRALYQDDTGLLWLGTLDDGLYTLDRTTNQFSEFNIRNNTPLKDNNIFSIIKSTEQEFLIATNSGMYLYNQETGKLTVHRMDKLNRDSLKHNSVFSIAEGNGCFWIGTWEGLHKYIPETSQRKARFVRYLHNANDNSSISSNRIRYIYNDPISTNLWIGTIDGGLNRLIQNEIDSTVRFIRYQFNRNNPNSLSDNYVTMIHRAKNGTLWITTKEGLNKFIEGGNGFKRYKEKDGLSSNLVQSILEDAHGNLWLGTNKGLSVFNPEKESFTNYDATDGLQSNEFSEHTCFKNKAGEMFFGGINGFNSFFPDSIRKNEYIPKIVIIDLLIFNKSVPIGATDGGRTILSKSITETDKIKLSYKDKVITFEFAALHYAAPGKNKYAYIMEGFDKKWSYSNSRKATYTNLKGGKYVFKVKASNNDGVWSDPIAIQISISHPFWQTPLAYTIYLILISITVLIVFKDIKTREKLKSDLRLKAIEKEKDDELNKMRFQFFTNIAHEFRNPLTLIISPLQRLIEEGKGSERMKKQFKLMFRNADHLLTLINELMDFRKSERGSMILNATETELIAFVKEKFTVFEDIAAKREINYQFKTSIDKIKVWIDNDKMAKAIFNLLSNAFKFVPDKGEIMVTIEKDNAEKATIFENKFVVKKDDESILTDVVVIKIMDNGIGISSKSISNIFNRFYQSPSDSDKHLGSGIGLAFTKNLVLLHKGEIEVQSTRGKGTMLAISLPLGDKHLDETEKINSFVPTYKADTLFAKKPSIDNITTDDETYTEPPETEMKDAPVILVVEDNDDMRRFIADNLAQKYNVIEAENGKIGLEKALEHTPDLIVSDVMMPEMNGITLCSRLKKDIKTSHIPVILLTALSSVAHQIEGIETGADDYISKPFNFKLFELKINNLISMRRKLHELFSSNIEIEPKDIAINPRDKEFLDKTIDIIKKNISETDLNVENLSKEVGMSRIHLHRKLKALTNQTPSVFIRTIRLKEGAKLLSENKYTISEISYMVGFTAPSYFTSCFGNQFGIPPKEYMERYGNIDSK